MKKSSDIQSMILSAVIAGTRTKIVLRMAEPTDASYLASVLFLGFIDYAEWKPGTERPVAAGNEKQIVHSSSVAEHEAEHEMRATTHSRAAGTSLASVRGTSTASGNFTGSGQNTALLLNPPLQLFGPSAPNATLPMLQYPTAESKGSNASEGSSDVEGQSVAESTGSFEMTGFAESNGQGRSRGTSIARGESETFVTRYELMPSQTYSASEQMERLTGEIMNLGLRECFVKIDNNRPIRTRTADLPPAFRSAYAKRLIAPVVRKTIARSPYLRAAAEVDAQITARTAVTLPPKPMPEADFGPQPLPDLVSDPVGFSEAFWATRPPTKDKPKPRTKKKPGRPPVGPQLDERHERFRVIDADVDNEPPTKR